MRKAVIVWGAIAAAIVAAVIVAGAFYFFSQVSRPGEATAKFIPASAPLYFSLNLRPGLDQTRMGREVISLLQTDAFLDWRDDLLDDIEDETDIHFLDDVSTWLGTDISFALLNVGADEPEEWVLLVQVGDRDSALDFAEDLVDYLEDEFSTDFDGDYYREADMWIADDEPMALGLTDEYLLVADGEDTLTDMIRNLESPPSRSLADTEDFIAARELVQAKRVTFLFVQVEDLLDAAEDVTDLYDFVGDEAAMRRQVRRNTPKYAAASTSFVEKGIRIDVVAESPSGVLVLDSESPLRSPEVVPADTLALVSGGGVQEIWEWYVDAIGGFDSYTADEFDRALRDFEDETGVDVEDDLIDRMSGEVAVAVLSSDLTLEGLDIGEPESIDALLLAGVEDGRRVEKAFDDIAAVAEEEGIEFDRERLGDYEAVTMDLDDSLFDDIGLEPGYVVTENWAVVGSTLESLEAFHDATTGVTDSLSSAPKFTRLMGMVPSPIHLLFYADIGGILDAVEDALDAETRRDYRRNVEPFIEPLDAFLLTALTTEEEMRVTAVLTLR